MLWTWKAWAVAGLASTSTLARTTSPPVSSTTASSIGPSVLHGPHHSAQRSTTTGVVMERSSTSDWKVASVTSIITATRIRVRGHAAALDVGPVAWPSTERAGEPVDHPAAVAGIDVANVTDWMSAHLPRLVPPLTFDLIAGAPPTLPSRLADADGGRWALRRPPLGHVLATAHDMAREHRIIEALRGTPVPVPPAIGLCADDA